MGGAKPLTFLTRPAIFSGAKMLEEEEEKEMERKPPKLESKEVPAKERKRKL